MCKPISGQDRVLLVCFLAVLFAACNDNKDDNKPSTYRVTFDTADGRPEITPKTVNSGERVQEPTVKPTKGDSVATGWINTATGQPYDFSTAVTADLFLKAFYSLKTYKVGFDTAGGTPATIDPQSVTHGEKAQQPEVELTKSDSVFNVWVNADTDQPYSFTDPVMGDLNLRATYSAPLGITFNTERLNNSIIERYHLTITSGGNTLENTVLSEGFYDVKNLRSQVADDDAITLNVTAYKKPTPNTATLTAEAFNPATNDADGRIFVKRKQFNLKGSDLDQAIELYLRGGGKARSSLRMVWDFTPFITFLQQQNPSVSTQKASQIQRYESLVSSPGWKLLARIDITQKGKRTAGPDMVEVHQPLDIAAGQYKVELTITSDDDQETYRFILDSEDFKHSSIIVMPNPMYAGEKIDRTKAPLVFRNGTQELSGWPEPEDE